MSRYIVTMIFTFLVSMPALAQTPPLTLEVSVDKLEIGPDDAFEVTILLVNTSADAVIVPAFEPSNQSSYFRLAFTHAESGVPAFFFKGFSEDPQLLAGNTMELPPLGSSLIQMTVNRDASGPLGYSDGGDNLQLLLGNLVVDAIYEVDSDNLPTAGNAALFRGRVEADNPAVIVVGGAGGPTTIPTLNQWGTLFLGTLLLFLGVLAIRRL